MHARLVIVLRKGALWGTKYSEFRPGGDAFDLTIAYGAAVRFEVADCRFQLRGLTLNRKLELPQTTISRSIVWSIFKGKESGPKGPRFLQCN